MNRRRHVSLNLPLLCVALALAVVGCQKSADQQSASSSPDAAAPTGSNAAASSTAKEPTPPPPPPKPLVVPAETVISVVLDQAVGSKISTPGQAFSATVQAPIEVDGKVAIPKGARASGIVKDAKPAGRFKGGAVLSLTLTSVTVKNEDYNIQTTAPSETSKGKGKRTAGMVGGGAGGGALIGGLAGGGKGAGIGAAVGAVTGTLGAAFTGNRDITLPAETELSFKLQNSITIPPKKPKK